MSLCGYNPDAFKIENGQLSIRNFCGEWVVIGDLTDPKDEPITKNVLDGRPDEPDDWQKCGKAAGMIDALARMLQNGWDSKDDELGFRSSVSAAVPSAKMGFVEMYVFQADILAAAYLLSDDDVVDADMIQAMKCRAAPGMLNNSTWSEAEVDYVKSAIAYEIELKFDAVTEKVVFALWEQAWQTLGPKDTGATIAIGASDTNADCSCPQDGGQATDPTVSGWYLGAQRDFGPFDVPHDPVGIPPLNSWGYPYDRLDADNDVYGIVFKVSIVSGGISRLKRSNDSGPVSAYDVYINNANSDYLSLDVEYCQMGNQAYNELISDGYISGPQLADNGGDYSDTVASPIGLKQQLVLFMCSLQNNGSPASVSIQTRWLYNTGSPSHQ